MAPPPAGSSWSIVAVLTPTCPAGPWRASLGAPSTCQLSLVRGEYLALLASWQWIASASLWFSPPYAAAVWLSTECPSVARSSGRSGGRSPASSSPARSVHLAPSLASLTTASSSPDDLESESPAALRVVQDWQHLEQSIRSKSCASSTTTLCLHTGSVGSPLIWRRASCPARRQSSSYQKSC